MNCSEEQIFISVSVCALCIMVLVSVAVELRARTQSQYPEEAADQALQRACRSPVATHPFLFMAMFLLAVAYVLLDPFATLFLPDDIALHEFANKL